MRILSGIQPTGTLHIGNYLGAIKQWTELQKASNLDKKAGCIFLIVDLHAITISYDPKQMQKNILSATMDYLAAGVDPKKNIIFTQSQIKEHAELAWLLETITPMGELERMTQYKEKSKQNKENINAGLFAYPVLMAADILLYKATIVPVGDDQAQHVELTREIARKFNNKFGQTFPEPKTQLQKTGARIMSLADPSPKNEQINLPRMHLSDRHGRNNQAKNKNRSHRLRQGNKIRREKQTGDFQSFDHLSPLFRKPNFGNRKRICGQRI